MLVPMIAMVALTFVVGLFTIVARFKAVGARTVDPRYFYLMQADQVPDNIIKTTRCFNNMFEVPLLFYVGCLALLVLDGVTPTAIGLAWAFVLFRLVQAAVHLTYNNVRHRMISFFLAFFSAMGLWLQIALSVS